MRPQSCYYCGLPGHIQHQCPSKSQAMERVGISERRLFSPTGQLSPGLFKREGRLWKPFYMLDKPDVFDRPFASKLTEIFGIVDKRWTKRKNLICIKFLLSRTWLDNLETFIGQSSFDELKQVYGVNIAFAPINCPYDLSNSEIVSISRFPNHPEQLTSVFVFGDRPSNVSAVIATILRDLRIRHNRSLYNAAKQQGRTNVNRDRDGIHIRLVSQSTSLHEWQRICSSANDAIACEYRAQMATPRRGGRILAPIKISISASDIDSREMIIYIPMEKTVSESTGNQTGYDLLIQYFVERMAKDQSNTNSYHLSAGRLGQYQEHFEGLGVDLFKIDGIHKCHISEIGHLIDDAVKRSSRVMKRLQWSLPSQKERAKQLDELNEAVGHLQRQDLSSDCYNSSSSRPSCRDNSSSSGSSSHHRNKSMSPFEAQYRLHEDVVAEYSHSDEEYTSPTSSSPPSVGRVRKKTRSLGGSVEGEEEKESPPHLSSSILVSPQVQSLKEYNPESRDIQDQIKMSCASVGWLPLKLTTIGTVRSEIPGVLDLHRVVTDFHPSDGIGRMPLFMKFLESRSSAYLTRALQSHLAWQVPRVVYLPQGQSNTIYTQMTLLLDDPISAPLLIMCPFCSRLPEPREERIRESQGWYLGVAGVSHHSSPGEIQIWWCVLGFTTRGDDTEPTGLFKQMLINAVMCRQELDTPRNVRFTVDVFPQRFEGTSKAVASNKSEVYVMLVAEYLARPRLSCLPIWRDSYLPWKIPDHQSEENVELYLDAYMYYLSNSEIFCGYSILIDNLLGF
eukprot:GHVH01004671.1.p1 GENE.GHVH01004671.1~~GHVH01004671.1.p1  ORF type:complete len:789 (+),score=53.63 GHVH01004671.1:28-2394(+)